MPITILDWAKAEGAREIDGRISASEFDRLGFAIFGGCQGCGATIAAYNAYPSKTGYWQCKDCIDDLGFETVESAQAFADNRE